MWQGELGAAIRRCSRNMLLVNLAFLVVLALTALGWGPAARRYVANWAQGPVSFAPDQADAVKDPDALARNRVTAELPKLMPVLHKTGSEEAWFYLAPFGQDQALLVRGPKDLRPGALEGGLEAIPQDARKKLDEVMVDVNARVGREIHVRPYLLDTEAFGWAAKAWAVAGLAIAAAAAGFLLWNVQRAFRWMSDPATHPVLRRLAEAEPLESVVPRMDQALSTGVPLDLGASALVQVGPSWFFHITSITFEAKPLAELAWIHGKTVKHKTYGITTGTTQHLVVHDRRGGRTEFKVKGEPAQEAFLSQVKAQAPWAVLGWSTELEALWKRDRAGFLAEVDRRRAGAPGA